MDAPKSGDRPHPEKRREKQRWPFIKKRVYLNGTIAWQVDARTKTGGERKAFGTRQEAETFADQCRTRRTNEGVTAFGNEELARYGKSVQDAISFYLEHLRAQEQTVPLETAIAELVESRRTGGKSAEYCYGLKLRLGRFGKDFTGRSTGSLTAKEIDAWLVGLKALPPTLPRSCSAPFIPAVDLRMETAAPPVCQGALKVLSDLASDPTHMIQFNPTCPTKS